MSVPTFEIKRFRLGVDAVQWGWFVYLSRFSDRAEFLMSGVGQGRYTIYDCRNAVLLKNPRRIAAVPSDIFWRKAAGLTALKKFAEERVKHGEAVAA